VSTIPANTVWNAEPVHSDVAFAIKHMIVSTYRGRFEDYSAQLTANPDGTLHLTGRVNVASVNVKDPNLLGHLSSPDFFDTENYPEITFDSTLVEEADGKLDVEGTLTIKGHTNPINAKGTITEPAVALGDVEKIGIELEATVDRTQYGLNWNAPLPKGGFALDNDVKLIANLELAREAA
jgi:polyisoprenoid-binding protein YceI